jgi:hypothetical protein
MVVPTPDYLVASYDDVTHKVDLEWSSTISAYGYVLEIQVDESDWQMLIPQSGEPSLSYSGNTLFTETNTSIYATQTGVHKYRVKACRSSGCVGDYAYAWIDLTLDAVIEWQPSIAKVGQEIELNIDSTVVQSCISIDAEPIRLTTDINGNAVARFYSVGENITTLLECFGSNNESLGEFNIPISVERLAAPQALERRQTN